MDPAHHIPRVMEVSGMELSEEQIRRMQENRAAALAKRQKRSDESLSFAPVASSSSNLCFQIPGRVSFENFVPAETRACPVADSCWSMTSTEAKELQCTENSRHALGPASAGGTTVNHGNRRENVLRASGLHGETPTAHHQMEVVLELLSTNHFTVTGSCIGAIRCLEEECVAELAKKLSSVGFTLPRLYCVSLGHVAFGLRTTSCGLRVPVNCSWHRFTLQFFTLTGGFSALGSRSMNLW